MAHHGGQSLMNQSPGLQLTNKQVAVKLEMINLSCNRIGFLKGVRQTSKQIGGNAE